MIVRRITKTSNDFQLVFALPNDEADYYRDEEDSFRKDVAFLIEKQFGHCFIENLNIDIQFLSFNYGDQLKSRPYNAPGKVIRKNEFCLEQIIGNNEM